MMPAETPGAERNLLFGVVALQMDFIDRDQLVAAMTAWAVAKRKPIGEILEEQGALSPTRRSVLEALVDEHVRQHGDDPAKSLASLSSVVSARETLEHVADPEVRASLGHLDEGEPLPTLTHAPSGPTSTASHANASPALTRFRILRPHAKGGLGAVSVALDAELNRHVALKQIQDRHADHDESRARFVLEAEITGGLEHPGIVPVYSLGHDAAGRPYYAMRFIQGDSLKRAIERFHAPEADRDPGRRTLEWQKLLRRFLDVCEAIAYAHSRGVLHRDLKPGNIMVGRYGETLVVDWGLAKLVGTPQDGAEATLRPASASGSSDTLPGSAIGTPSYMSPEQAAGDLERLGPRSDVYSLGATLYALLAGQAPIEGADIPTILDRVRRGEVPPPRQVNAKVPAALDAICRKAMAWHPEDRYATSLELAADIEAWLADEPVSAWREPLSVRARRWVNRHQRLVSGGAATVLMGLVTLAALAVVITSTNRRLDLANTKLARANTDLEQANTDLALARAEAERERDQAEAVTEFLVSSFRSPDPTLDGREITIAEVLDRAVEELKRREDLAPATEATILEAIGETYRGLGLPSRAIEAHEAAERLRLKAQGAGHPDTLRSRRLLAVALTLAGRLDEAIAMLEPTIEAQRHRLGAGHPDTLSSWQVLGLAYQEAGRLIEAIAILDRTAEALRERLGDDHPDTLSAQQNLAVTLKAAGRMEEAIPLYERTLATARDRFGDDHPDVLLLRNDLAVAYSNAGRVDESLTLQQRILEAQRTALGEEHPSTLTSGHNLAVALGNAGRLEEAIPLMERTWEARRAVLGDDHPATLTSQNSLGYLYDSAGRMDKAFPLFEQGLEATRAKLGEDHPDTLRLQNNLAYAYESVGRLDDAIVLYERTLEGRRAKLGHDHRSTLITQGNLAYAYNQAGRRDKAITLYEQTLKSQRARLGDDHPDTLISQHLLGRTYAAAGRLPEAIALLERTLEARRAVLGDDHPDTLVSGYGLAQLLEASGRPAEALSLYEAAAQGIASRLDGLHPYAYPIRAGLAQAYLAAGRPDAAAQVARIMVEAEGRREPRDDAQRAASLGLLGASLIDRADYDEAEPLLREALQLREATADGGTAVELRHELGEALIGLGRLDEAESLLLETYRTLSDRAEVIPVPLRDGLLREAVERLIRLYEAWGKSEEAARWYRERAALRAEPALPDNLFAPPDPASRP